MNTLFKILLFVSIIVLGYMCVRSILSPIQFEDERKKREQDVINRLIDIRKAQVEFRAVYGYYSSSFPSLINFVNDGKIPVVRKEGELTDKQLEEGLTEELAVKQGIIKRDTFYVSVKDSIFGNKFNADSLNIIPHSDRKFTLKAAKLRTPSGVLVDVFEATASMDDYLEGLDKQEIINLKEDAVKMNRFPGLKVGSVEEPNNNAGNWE